MYRENYDGQGIVRMSDNALIPQEESNADWRSYLVWLGKGNPPAPATPLPTPEASDIDTRLKALEKRQTAQRGQGPQLR